MTLRALRPIHLIALVCTVLYANWILAIARFQPNVMFMDQWDYFLPLFNGDGAWARFVLQHGPVREGLGLIITGWILEATSWDVRYDSVWVATILVVATALAVRLKWKMTGTIGWLDAWIPLLGLWIGQFETVFLVPQVSHSVMPLTLILLAANLWLCPRPVVRYIGGGACGFLLMFTGFGLFGALMIAMLLAVRLVRHARQGEYRATAAAALATAALVAAWFRFADDYVFQPAVEGFRFPWTPWTDYVEFLVLMLNLPLGHYGDGRRHYLIGTVLAVMLLLAALGIARLYLRRRPSFNDEVLVLLMGSGLLFVAATAVGRVPLGLLAGLASRYLALMLTLWLAVYLGAATSYPRLRPLATLCVWILAVWPYTGMGGRPLAEWPGTLGAPPRLVEAMEFYGTNKAAWAEVYLETASVDAAQTSVKQIIYPNPEQTRLDEKVQFLQKHKLSFFSGRAERRDYLPWLADDRFSCPALSSSPHACR